MSNLDSNFYQNELLHKHDDRLIDKEKIEKKIKVFHDNYYSDEYQNYLKILEIIPKKFIKKNYKVDYQGKDITIYQVNKENLKELHKIESPKYINIMDKLDELKNIISHQRGELLNQYNNLLLSEDVIPLTKNEFVEKKKEFMENLHEYYAYKKFYITINNLNLENKKNIIYYELIESKLHSNDVIMDNLEGESHPINIETIRKINTLKLEKLNIYNEIVDDLKCDEKSKELNIKIQEYLSQEKEKEVYKLLELDIVASKNKIEYVLLEKLSISNVNKLTVKFL